MCIRHIAYKETLDRGYASEWNDDHTLDYSNCIVHQGLFIGPALGAEWDFTETAGGSNPTWTLVGAAGSGHAYVVLNTGGVTGQTSVMKQELQGAASNITSIADYPMWTMTVQIAAVHTAGLVAEFGFFDNGVNIFTGNQDGAYFRVLANVLYAVTGTGAAETTTNLGAFSEYEVYKIRMTSVGAVNTVYFYVDDMQSPVATHTTNLPDSNLTVKVGVQSQNNVDSTLRVDSYGLMRLRKSS